MTTVDAPEYHIAVLDRTLDLLEALGRSERPLGTSELARDIGATKTAVFRILVNLERRGYVQRVPGTSKYRLGMRLVQLGQRSLETVDLRQAARPAMEDLHMRFNETVNLGVPVDDGIIYVDMIESDHGLRMSARVGALDEFHATALGKAILTFLPEDRRETILCRPLPRRTPNTLTDPDALRAELANIRRKGYAEDCGENEEGARCFGAPIFDHRGEAIAAISVSGPESRLGDDKRDQIAPALKFATDTVTERIGGNRPKER